MGEEIVRIDNHVRLEERVDDDDLAACPVQTNIAWVIRSVLRLHDRFCKEHVRHLLQTTSSLARLDNTCGLPWRTHCSGSA